MSAKQVPQRILYDTLREAIAGRRVKTAAFLTFQLEPSFFETEILTALFDSPWSNIPKVRLVQLEECLRSTQHVAVYYDRHGLIASDESAKLDYRRIPLARKTGYFHPKAILALVENIEKDLKYESLVACVSSANLTRAGWWENVEVFQVLEVSEGEKISYRQDLKDLIARIRKESQPDHDHAALEDIQQFLVRHVDDSGISRREGKWLPRLFVGMESFEDFVSGNVPRGEFNLEIVSPYFDAGNDSTALNMLLEATEPKETRIFLPVESDGTTACTSKYFTLVQNLPRAKWANLPPELLQRASQQSTALTPRRVHAKLYRFWNQEREILFAGSVNLTKPGFSKGNSGNLELAALVEPSEDSSHTWWLEPIEEETPAKFASKAAAQEEAISISLEIAFRFHWNTRTFEYYCEESAEGKKLKVEVETSSGKLFEIGEVRFNRWIELSQEDSKKIEKILHSTSFLSVRVNGSESFPVLVQEEGMAQKPSLLRELTPEEILNYWSLLTPEQRERFLLQRILTPVEQRQEGIVLPPQSGIDSMFDRFAGIFHAFNQLEQHVVKAVQENREQEAVYRLLGEKYDSLPSLVSKVIEAKEGDIVNRYITLLSSRQLLDRIQKDLPEFASAYRAEFKKIYQLLERTDDVRKAFAFGSDRDRQQFLEWFDRVFLLRMNSQTEEEA